MSIKHAIFGPRTVNALGLLLLFGLLLQLVGWSLALPMISTIGWWLTTPFLLMLLLLFCVAIPHTWWTSRQR